jgi:hypothetical protein
MKEGKRLGRWEKTEVRGWRTEEMAELLVNGYCLLALEE